MNNNIFLPIGTVVLLKGAKRKVMIMGYAQKEESNDKIWDYCGCAFPIGVISSKKNLLFNNDQIEEVVYVGHVDEESKIFMKQLEAEMEEIRNNG